MSRIALLLAVAAAVAACSPSDPKSRASAPASGAEPAATAWKAADACSLVSKADVAAAAGAQVKTAQLEGVSAGGSGLAVVSTCRYDLDNGATITLLAREAPSADAIDAAIAAARTMGGFAPPATDIAGFGKAAMWTPSMNTLQVFIDDKRYVTLAQFPAGGDPQKALVDIARTMF